MSEGYEIGYGKPPVRTKFRKGKSGNPKGRPKGSKSLGMQEGFGELLLQKTTIVENGKPVKITLIDAFRRRLLMDAINGKAAAMKTLFAIMKEFNIATEHVQVPAHECPNECISKLLQEITEANTCLPPHLMQATAEREGGE